MDEFVIVKFPHARDVVVDGNITAVTNEKFILNTGTHIFSLAGDDDYEPSSQTHLVEHTTADDPFVVEFAPKPAAAPPGAGNEV